MLWTAELSRAKNQLWMFLQMPSWKYRESTLPRVWYTNQYHLGECLRTTCFSQHITARDKLLHGSLLYLSMRVMIHYAPKCTHCCSSCPFFPALSMVWHTFQRAPMTFSLSHLIWLLCLWFHTLQSYLSILIPSAPMNNLAAVLGETDTKYLPPHSHIFTFCSCREQWDLFVWKKQLLCHTKPARKNCSQRRGKARQHSRSNNADAAFPLRIPQTLHPPGSLIERGQTGTEVGWITTVCKHQHRDSVKGSDLEGLQLQDWTEERLLTSWHFSQSPWDFPEGLSPSGSGVCHHTDVVAHIPEILRQGDSCNRDNSVLQDTVQKGILCSYVVRKM